MHVLDTLLTSILYQSTNLGDDLPKVRYSINLCCGWTPLFRPRSVVPRASHQEEDLSIYVCMAVFRPSLY